MEENKKIETQSEVLKKLEQRSNKVLKSLLKKSINNLEEKNNNKPKRW